MPKESCIYNIIRILHEEKSPTKKFSDKIRSSHREDNTKMVAKNFAQKGPRK
jgi:hypothetical protein